MHNGKYSVFFGDYCVSHQAPMQQPGVLNYPKTYRSPETSLLSPLFAARTFTTWRHKPGRRFIALYDITTNWFPTLCALVDTFSRRFNWLTGDTLLQNHVKSTFASLHLNTITDSTYCHQTERQWDFSGDQAVRGQQGGQATIRWVRWRPTTGRKQSQTDRQP